MMLLFWILVAFLTYHRHECYHHSSYSHLQVNNLTINGWKCNFRETNCGIINQDRMPEQFVYFSNSTLNSADGFYMLNIAHCSRGGGRLVTPYYQTSFTSQACLHIRALFFGHGIDFLRLYQQDDTNQMVWKRRPDFKDVIQEFRIPLVLEAHKSVRFFFEVQFSSDFIKSGFILVDSFQLFPSKCALS